MVKTFKTVRDTGKDRAHRRNTYETFTRRPGPH